MTSTDAPRKVIDPVWEKYGWDKYRNTGLHMAGTRLLVNPHRPVREGRPSRDTGLTGRKIIADTYGGYAGTAAAPSRQGPHQGGPLRCIHGTVHRQEPGAAGLATSARSRSPMPSAWPTPSASWWKPSGPASDRMTTWRRSFARSSTCGPKPSSTASSSGGPSTRRHRLRPLRDSGRAHHEELAVKRPLGSHRHGGYAPEKPVNQHPSLPYRRRRWGRAEKPPEGEEELP